MLRLDRRDLDHAPAEIAAQQLEAALGRERLRGGTDDRGIAARGCGRLPDQGVALQAGPLAVALQTALAGDGEDVGVGQPGVQQLPDDVGHATGGLELVHVRQAVGVDPREQGRDARDVGEIIPVEQDAGGAGHRHQMQRVVGRAAGGHQADDAVDESALVEHPPNRGEGVAERRDLGHALGGGTGQGIPQRCVGVDEGGTRQVQAHDLHQHLVGVGRAVEGAGAGRMVGGALGLQEVLRGRACPRRRAGGRASSRCSKTRRHGAGRHQHGGQVTEGERTDDQAGNDLVADAKHQGAVEHVVAEGDRGAHGDHVAADQGQLHADLTLGDAVAHGRDAAGDLGCRTRLPRRLADQFGEPLVRLVGRKHVVVGGDDPDVGRLRDPGAAPCRWAPQAAKAWARLPHDRAVRRGPRAAMASSALEVGAAAVHAPLPDPLGDVGDDGMQRHGRSPVANVSGLPRTRCGRPARSARSPRWVPSCRRDRAWAAPRWCPRPGGSARPSATPPRPRRGA